MSLLIVLHGLARTDHAQLEYAPAVEGNEIRAVPIVAITGNVVRHRGKGMHRHAGKTEASLRIVPLPQCVVTMWLLREQIGVDVPVFPAASRNGPGWNWKDPNDVVNNRPAPSASRYSGVPRGWLAGDGAVMSLGRDSRRLQLGWGR